MSITGNGTCTGDGDNAPYIGVSIESIDVIGRAVTKHVQDTSGSSDTTSIESSTWKSASGSRSRPDVSIGCDIWYDTDELGLELSGSTVLEESSSIREEF